MDTTTRQAKRAPVTLKIKFKSATLDQFIERYAVDVSPGGIFIRTKEPLAVGTQMRFEFQLRDATPLITGEGTVVWTRENDPARPAAAPGMGVRFDRLGDGSQTVLDKILAEKAKQPAAAPAGGADGPKGFLEVPTKVAPSPLVGALASETRPKLGSMAPARAGFADEVAALRGVGEATVRQQARAIYRKAGLAGRNELAAFFLEDLLGPRTP